MTTKLQMVSVVMMFRPSVAAYGNESFFTASEYIREMAGKRSRKTPFIIPLSSDSREEMKKRDKTHNKVISDQVGLTETDGISKNNSWKSLISKHRSQIIRGKDTRNSSRNRLLSFLKKFCNTTSLHGFHYLVEQERSYYERLFWILALCGVYVCCFLSIRHSISHWLDSPAIVTMENKPTPVGLIPFPAVTVCGTNQLNQSVFNTSAYYSMSVTERANVNRTYLNQVDYASIFCAHSQIFNLEQSSLDTIDLNVFHYMINNAHIACKEIFTYAKWSNETLRNPCDYMQPVLTDLGLCHSFNMLPFKVLLTDYYYEVMQMYNFMKNLSIWSKTDSVDWTPENGYSGPQKENDVPRRTSGSGLKHALTMSLKISNASSDEKCFFGFTGYTILIHSPAEMPTSAYAKIGASKNTFHWVTILPKKLRTSSGVKMWSPQDRGCYFDHERKLHFFKLYTQVNCDLECESNYSLQSCGCVAFYHPRSLFTPICSQKKMDCIEDSVVRFAELYTKAKSGCGCLPSCTNLEYDVDVLTLDGVSYDSIIKNLNPNMTNIPKITTVSLAYQRRDTLGVIRSGMYGFTDFLGNVGGIMGLFLGFSWFSLLEIVYFVIIRPIANRRNRVQNEPQ